MAKRPKARAAAGKDDVLSLDRAGSNPVLEAGAAAKESIPHFDSVLTGALVELLEAKAELDAIKPQVDALNSRYDTALARVESELVESELLSASCSWQGRRVVATLAQVQRMRVINRARLVSFCMSENEGLLTVNTNTLRAWLKEEADEELRQNPQRIGVELEDHTQLQARFSQAK